jgi:prepilin-type N-terminal cleavage/methylation domain-containing protein
MLFVSSLGTDQPPTKETTRMRRTDGFTLLELMVIVAIVAILSTIAVAGYSYLIEKTRLSTAANEIKGDLELAKLTAVRRHATILAYFDDGTGKNGGYTLSVNTKNGETLLSRTMPARVVLNGISSPVGFNSMGIASTPGQVVVKTADGSTHKRITVSAAGNIKLERSTDGTHWED